jgi:hypothetical protein
MFQWSIALGFTLESACIGTYTNAFEIGVGHMKSIGAIKHASALFTIILPILVIAFGEDAYALNPEIASCPKVIYAVGGFNLFGQNFGTAPGAIHIRFLESEVQLPNGVTTNELTLTAQSNGWSSGLIQSNEIAHIYPMGAADSQKVSITVSIQNSKITSNPCQAYFKSVPTILGGSSGITPNQLFMLTGWNFGHAGTLNVHFATPSHNTNVPIPTPPSSSWKRYAIMLKLPSVSGFVGQMADIRLVRLDGKGSNVWKATFTPTIGLTNVPGWDVASVACSNAGVDNFCSPGGYTEYFCITDPLISAAGSSPSSMVGQHTGCWGIGSTNGTDTYSVTVKSGWLLAYVDFTPATQYDPCCQDNGSVYPNDIYPVAMTNVPNPYTFDVPWHIGSSGGWVSYEGNFVVQGPKGVPY